MHFVDSGKNFWGVRMSCKIVAEIGINANGDINIAKQLMDACRLAGVDMVKFQKRTIDAVYTKEELDRPRESPWGTTNRQQKEGLEFGLKEYFDIYQYSRVNKLPFFASPWDVASVEFLKTYNPPYMKVASASITDYKLLEAIRETNIPVIISTGMSTRDEVYAAVDWFGDQLKYILACTATYPTANNEVNLNHLQTLKKEFPKYKIGFSNHSPGIIYMVAAVALGAEMIEFHVTLDRAMYGSDQAASIEVPGILSLCKYVHRLEIAMGTGEWVVFPSEQAIKDKLRK